jgi:hypothetical protein
MKENLGGKTAVKLVSGRMFVDEFQEPTDAENH